MLITVLAAIDLDTILQVGVFLFIIISTLAGQLFSKNNPRGGKPKGQKPQPRPRPERPRPEPPRQPQDPRPQAQPWNEPVEVRMPRERPLVAEPVQPEVVAVDVVPVEPVVVRESVAEHVQRHIESGGIDSTRLQSKVEQADERMTSHLHEAFDHRLGQLEGQGSKLIGTTVASTKSAALPQQTPPAGDSSDLAARVAQMMRTPADLSAAIVLNEILKRPEDRWNE
jgi:hypothetical protein